MEDSSVEYEVEAIVGHKISKSVIKYKIKWTGYDSTTWEPEENLTNCLELLNSYKSRNSLDGNQPTIGLDPSNEPSPILEINFQSNFPNKINIIGLTKKHGKIIIIYNTKERTEARTLSEMSHNHPYELVSYLEQYVKTTDEAESNTNITSAYPFIDIMFHNQNFILAIKKNETKIWITPQRAKQQYLKQYIQFLATMIKISKR